ncbi:uncharacterized protein LOC108681965 [Hyalella azteca]|uniref:Uncharacterized protein LOC108681965 n=1 Tax=Hyalella azteca TaxID=294128 RepID=A0A8B7PK40_HYAAZ|nr:uncharacterized protein LOC108681965 [Hyalella azteca]
MSSDMSSEASNPGFVIPVEILIQDRADLWELFRESDIKSWMPKRMKDLCKHWLEVLLPGAADYSDDETKKIIRYDFENFWLTYNDHCEILVDVDACLEYVEEDLHPEFLEMQLFIAEVIMQVDLLPLRMLYSTSGGPRRVREIRRDILKTNLFVIVLCTRNVDSFLDKALSSHTYVFRSDDHPISDQEKEMMLHASWETYTSVLSFMFKILEENCPSLPLETLVRVPDFRKIIMVLIMQHFALAYSVSSPIANIEQHFARTCELLMYELNKIMEHELQVERLNAREPNLALFIIHTIISTIKFSLTASTSSF